MCSCLHWAVAAVGALWSVVSWFGNVLSAISSSQLVAIGRGTSHTFWTTLGLWWPNGVGHSVILRTDHAYSFMGSVGGVPADIQLSMSYLVSAAADEHAISSMSSSRAVKKAPQTPLGFVASMERIVIDLLQPKFVRAF